MDGHDLFGVLDAQHHPDHQSEQIRQTHPAEERKAVVLRRGQVAVHVHRGHHAAQTRVRSDRRVAASSQREGQKRTRQRPRSTCRYPQCRSTARGCSCGCTVRYKQENKKYERSISSSLTPFMYFSGMTNLFGSHFAACGKSQNKKKPSHRLHHSKESGIQWRCDIPCFCRFSPA